MATPKLLLLMLTVASAADPSAQTPSVIDAPSSLRASATTRRRSSTNDNFGGRWLTYACNSRQGTDVGASGGGRRLLDRLLSHPCNSHARQSTSASSLYNKNTTKGSSTVLNVVLGAIAGVLALLGILFLIDRETFTDLTGVKGPSASCSCTKPRIDDDDDCSNGQTPYERDLAKRRRDHSSHYLTQETANYLEEKHDREVERPRRLLRSWFWCCFRTKDYGDSDKYHIPWSGSEVVEDGDGEKKGGLMWRVCMIPLVLLEEIRLRCCWRRTKVYDDRDKYNVKGASDEEGKDEDDDVYVKYAASSYESAEAGTTPW